jgi:transglutaminase-like putative cysteine protease
VRGWVIALALLAANDAGAATILERRVELEIEGGRLLEEHYLLVRLEAPDDVEEWRRFAIPLDKNVKLESSRAQVLDVEGKVLRKIKRGQHHRLESAGSGVYTSASARLIPFDDLEVGQRLRIEYALVARPYYPTLIVGLLRDDPQSLLTVRVTGAGSGFRWRIGGSRDGFQVREGKDGLEIEGRDLPAYAAPEHGPPIEAATPVLRVGWRREGSWQDIGLWYEEQTAGLPRGDPEVADLARSLVGDVEFPREKVRILSDHVRRAVRYEAVQIGPGGYIPTPAREVVGRAWGDCKDKAELLCEMLRAIGAPCYLALVSADLGKPVDTEFPTPTQFNHVIVAIPASAAGAGPEDPVAEGLLFVDPTVERGTLSWLEPAARGGSVLVLDGQRSRMVRIPDEPEADLQVLEIDAGIEARGDLRGRLRLNLTGSGAVAWLERFAEGTRASGEEDVRWAIGATLSGARLAGIEWDRPARAAPCTEMRAELSQANAVRGEPGRRAFRAEGLDLFPEPRLLDDRTVPVVLRAGERITTWRLTVPEDWCPVESFDEVVENEIGRVVTHVSQEEGRLTVIRRVRLGRSWIESRSIAKLRELAIAETRANRRQIRFRCPE